MSMIAVRRPSSHAGNATVEFDQPFPAQLLLRKLLASSLVLVEDWEKLAPDARDELAQLRANQELLPKLVEYGLLTEYQADRIEAGNTFGMVLGNYRVLERLGAGGMGVVFKAEHTELRRLVALKVLSQSAALDPRILRRFSSEIRAVAQLQHPNIVAAMDAGKCPGPHEDSPDLRYFVMEYVPGEDLEQFVQTHGPLSPAEVCDVGYQIASALAEAHSHNLVHRDIKPSNVLLTPERQAKLLDFGLARYSSNRMTQPGTVLGTMDYMAPEQARDAGSVDIRADIYSLGATLFWCLTGRPPFSAKESLAADVLARLTQAPPSVRAERPEIPAELDATIARMMATNPTDRYPTPKLVMQALIPFLKPELRDHFTLPAAHSVLDAVHQECKDSQTSAKVHHILIVDDEAPLREFCSFALHSHEFLCDQAEDGLHALEAMNKKRYDLVVLDIDMPRMTGPEVCRHLRAFPPCPHLKIIMTSGRATSDEMAKIMLAGADDYLTKPLSVPRLQARVKAALRLKDAQDRSDQLNQHLLALNQELEQNLDARDSDLVHARNALVLALAELVGYRDAETGAHLMRMQRYCRCLAEEAAQLPSLARRVEAPFIQMLECCAPLHDIGKAGLPDHILMKPGKLASDERVLMQTHTTIGADILLKVAKQHNFARAFLQMAFEIARHHHERFDGTGYPDRLSGEDIPLAARIVAIADVYDALRSRRVYKPALSHDSTVRMMTEEFIGHFDPSLVQVFQRCETHFAEIFCELPD